MFTKRKFISFALIIAMTASAFTSVSLISQLVTKAANTQISVDASAENWSTTNLTVFEVDGGAEFTGTPDIYGTGAVLNTKLNVSDEVTFDLEFTKEAMSGSGLFAITFGVDGNSFNQPSKGPTYIMYKKVDDYIECDKGTSGWMQYIFKKVNSFRFAKAADGWKLYFNDGSTEKLLGEVKFDAFAEDGFGKDMAYLGVYVLDQAGSTNEISYKITNVKHMGAKTETCTAVEAPADKWSAVNLKASDVKGGAEFTGNAAEYGTGVTLNTKLNVSDEVTFDLEFTKEAMSGSGLFAITFGVDGNSFNQPSKGPTYIMYKKVDDYIECDKGTNGWMQYIFKKVNSFRFTKATDGWKLYFNDGNVEKLMGKVGFDTFPADGFNENMAYFGVYVLDSGNPSNEISFKVTNIKHNASGAGGDESSEPVLNAYDLNTYTIPYWKGDTVYNESVMVLKNKDGSISPIPLLYTAKEIISVRSSDLKTEYEKGKDWDIKSGKLIIPENSSVPFMTYDEYYPDASDMETVDGKYIYFSEGSFFHNKQIAITYKRASDWNWSIPEYKGDKLSKTVAKLKNNEPLKIVFYGDSITTGANSSGFVGAAPYAATWMTMFEESLKKEYKNNNITSVNTAVGGMVSAWGAENVKERVVNHNPDLAVIGFGMNDGNGNYVSAEMYKNNINTIIQAVKQGNPNAEIILVSPMLPNPEAKMTDGNHATYEDALLSLETDGIAVAPITKMYLYLMKNKRYYDMTGNNINHPNDFAARLYAQVLNATLIESEPVKQLVYPDKTYVLPTNDAYWKCLYNSTASNGVITLDESGSASYTGSKLKNRLAQFEMEAKIPIGKWVGLTARQSDYTAAPWDQDTYLVTISDTGKVTLYKCINSNMSIVGEVAQCNAVVNGTMERTSVRFGVFDDEGGARIVLDIAGENILNVLDTSPIKESGYTGFVTLETATAKIYTGPEGTDADVLEDLSGYGKGKGYLGGKINPEYEVAWPVITDYIYRGKMNLRKVLTDEISEDIDTNDKIDKIKADGNTDVVVTLKSPQVISKSIFECLAGRDKNFIVKIVDDGGNLLYSIKFYGKNLEVGKEYDDFDPTLSFDSAYEKNIGAMIGNAKITMLEFKDELPCRSTVVINLNNKYAADTLLRLYGYDVQYNNISRYDQDIVVTDDLYATLETGTERVYFLSDDISIKIPEQVIKDDKSSMDNIVKTGVNITLAVLMSVIAFSSAVVLISINKKCRADNKAAKVGKL